MKAIEIFGIMIMLVVICALGSYGQGYYAQPMTFQQANAQFFAGMAQIEQAQMQQAQAQMAELMRIAQGGGVPASTGAGGVVFPIYNPSAASDMQQFAQFEENCRRIATMPMPQNQTATQNYGLSTADGSAQLFHATVQNYQNQARQDRQFAQWGLNKVDNPTPENQRTMQALGNMAEAGLSSAKAQSQRLERNQKREANRELYNATGKEHWQYMNRPVTPGPEQDAYDNWNKTTRRWE